MMGKAQDWILGILLLAGLGGPAAAQVEVGLPGPAGTQHSPSLPATQTFSDVDLHPCLRLFRGPKAYSPLES